MQIDRVAHNSIEQGSESTLCHRRQLERILDNHLFLTFAIFSFHFRIQILP